MPGRAATMPDPDEQRRAARRRAAPTSTGTSGGADRGDRGDHAHPARRRSRGRGSRCPMPLPTPASSAQAKSAGVGVAGDEQREQPPCRRADDAWPTTATAQADVRRETQAADEVGEAVGDGGDEREEDRHGVRSRTAPTSQVAAASRPAASSIRIESPTALSACPGRRARPRRGRPAGARRGRRRARSRGPARPPGPRRSRRCRAGRRARGCGSGRPAALRPRPGTAYFTTAADDQERASTTAKTTQPVADAVRDRPRPGRAPRIRSEPGSTGTTIPTSPTSDGQADEDVSVSGHGRHPRHTRGTGQTRRAPGTRPGALRTSVVVRRVRARSSVGVAGCRPACRSRRGRRPRSRGACRRARGRGARRRGARRRRRARRGGRPGHRNGRSGPRLSVAARGNCSGH